MKGKQRINRLLRALFCLALALSLTAVDVAPAAALVSQADIDALKARLDKRVRLVAPRHSPLYGAWLNARMTLGELAL